MTLRILSIGKTNLGFVQEGIRMYLNRLQRYIKVDWIELPDVKNGGALEKNVLKNREDDQFLQRIRPGEFLVLLDEHGKAMDSVMLSRWLDHRLVHGSADLVFVIGGAYGFGDKLHARADAKLSLSKLTFNHQMVRLILAEQLYRAFTIQRGEPYHHA